MRKCGWRHQSAWRHKNDSSRPDRGRFSPLFTCPVSVMQETPTVNQTARPMLVSEISHAKATAGSQCVCAMA